MHIFSCVAFASLSYFVLLGAGAAMGPFEILLQFGGNIIALDLDRKNIWQRLIATARKSPGTITFPLKVCSLDLPLVCLRVPALSF